MKQAGKKTKADKKKQYGNVVNFEEARALKHRKMIEDDRKRRGRELNREFGGDE